MGKTKMRDKPPDRGEAIFFASPAQTARVPLPIFEFMAENWCCKEGRAANGAALAVNYGRALPVITRFRLGMVNMKATTEEAVILADES